MIYLEKLLTTYELADACNTTHRMIEQQVAEGRLMPDLSSINGPNYLFPEALVPTIRDEIATLIIALAKECGIRERTVQRLVLEGRLVIFRQRLKPAFPPLFTVRLVDKLRVFVHEPTLSLSDISEVTDTPYVTIKEYVASGILEPFRTRADKLRFSEEMASQVLELRERHVDGGSKRKADVSRSKPSPIPRAKRPRRSLFRSLPTVARAAVPALEGGKRLTAPAVSTEPETVQQRQKRVQSEERQRRKEWTAQFIKTE